MQEYHRHADHKRAVQTRQDGRQTGPDAVQTHEEQSVGNTDAEGSGNEYQDVIPGRVVAKEITSRQPYGRRQKDQCQKVFQDVQSDGVNRFAAFLEQNHRESPDDGRGEGEDASEVIHREVHRHPKYD